MLVALRYRKCCLKRRRYDMLVKNKNNLKDVLNVCNQVYVCIAAGIETVCRAPEAHAMCAEQAPLKETNSTQNGMWLSGVRHKSG